jgi:HEAT repeat protein
MRIPIVYLVLAFGSMPWSVAKAETDLQRQVCTYFLHYTEQGSVETYGVQRIALKVTGHLTQTEVSITPAHHQVRYVCTEAVSSTNDRRDAALQAALERGCLVTTDTTGRMTRIAFPQDTGPTERNFWRGLLARLAFIRPEKPLQTWRVQQQDPDGNGTFQYRWHRPGTCSRILLGYALSPRSIGAKERSLPVVRGTETVTFRFNADGELLHVDGKTQLRTVLLPATIVSNGNAVFSLQRMQTAHTDKMMQQAIQQEIRRFVASSPSLVEIDPAARLAAMRQELGGQTGESLLQKLATINTPLSAAEEQALFSQVCCWVALDSSAVFRLHALVTAPQTGEQARSVALAVLGATAASPSTVPTVCEQAEQALCALLDNRDEMLCQDALLALRDCYRPQRDTFQKLRHLALMAPSSDGRQAALLIFGSLLRNADRTVPALAEREARWLFARLKSARSEAETQTLLLSLGNAGLPSAFPTLMQYARQPGYRATALYALRFVPDPRVTALLLQGLSSPDESAREEAGHALLFRPLTAPELAALGRALTHERNDAVRLLLLENIHLERPYHPRQAQSLLERYRRDRSADVRQAVAAWRNEQ